MSQHEVSLWHAQEYRKTLLEVIEETVSAFSTIDAWQYDTWDIAYSGGI